MKILNKKEFKIFLTFFIIYICFARFQWSHDDTKLDLTRAIVDEHSLKIDNYVNNTGDRVYYKGHYYSDKAPGASFLTVPIYFVFKIFFGMPDNEFKLRLLEFIIVFLSSAFFSALLVVLMYKISRFFLKKEIDRILITVIFGLGTGIFVYSTIYYQYGISIFFAFLSFYLIFKMKKEKTGNYYFLAGLSAGMAFITDYLTTAIILCCFTILIFNKKWKNLFLFCCGFSIFILILFYYHYTIFGNPFDLSYVYLDENLKNNEINKYQENLVELWEKNNLTINHIDFEEFFEYDNFACFYALNFVYSSNESKVQIRTGSDDKIKVWLNEKLIIKNENARKAIINQDIANVSLKKGWNKVLIKLCNNRYELNFFFVITNESGHGINGLSYNCYLDNMTSISNIKDSCDYLGIGPFDNSPYSKKLTMWDFYPKTFGFEKEYPPEREIILDKNYKGKYDYITWIKMSNSKEKNIKFNFLTKGILVSIKRIPQNIGYIINISLRLIFYPYRGLFFYNPILIFSLIGLFLMFKYYRLEMILIVISFIMILLICSCQWMWMWWQGSSFGPRFMLPIIPLFMLPLMFCVKKINKKVLLFFMAVSIFISLLGMQEFEQEINQGGNSFPEIHQNTMEKCEEEFYSMKPLGNPLFTYYMPLFLKYGPRSILIEEMLGFRLPPFLNVFILIIIVAFIWRKEIFKKKV